MENPAPTNVPIHDLIRRRWSPRAFVDRGVETQDLVALLEAARWAPSSGNEQPWRFLIARREEPENFARLLACLVPGNQRWAASAPVLLLTTTRRAFLRHDKPNRHAMHDAGLALANLLIEATARGLAAHPMAGFDAAAARTAFSIPEDFEPVAAVAIGYSGGPEQLPDDLRQREIAPRTRRPLAESVFGTTWGEGVTWLEDASPAHAAPGAST
jgi:nitroreductase